MNTRKPFRGPDSDRARDAAPPSGAWRATVQLLLDCPGIDARDRTGLHKVLCWRKLGRAEEGWLEALAARHLGNST